jgi:hypothetical protein
MAPHRDDATSGTIAVAALDLGSTIWVRTLRANVIGVRVDRHVRRPSPHRRQWRCHREHLFSEHSR